MGIVGLGRGVGALPREKLGQRELGEADEARAKKLAEEQLGIAPPPQK